MQLLEKYFEIAISTPDGIQRLRELILKLAFQGKLVPHDDIKNSLNELISIQNLRNEKERKNINLLDNKILSQIKEPYPIPKNWIWSNLHLLGSFINGDRGKNYPSRKDYVDNGIPFINAGHLHNGIVELNEMNYISEMSYEKLGGGKVQENDILYCLRGSLGKCAVVRNINKGAIASSLVIIRPIVPESSTFLYYYLISPLGKEMIYKYDNGTAQPNLSSANIQKFIIPLPPLEEQKRIVAKIDELMRLCDLLEKQRDSKNDLISKINSSAINKLIKAEDEYSLAEAWQFIQNQFELIFSDKKNVFDLKEVILNLAMRGKLSTSDINDIPASFLMTTIEEERKSLIKQKIISKQKEQPKIGDTEKKYNLPLGWEWVRLNEYGIWKSGSTPSRTNQSFYGGDIPWVKSGEVKQGRIKETSETITELAIEKCSLHRNPIGSVLIAMYGANIGEVGVLEIEAATNQAVCACKTYSPIYNEFLYFLLLSLRENFISQGAGAAQPNISREKIINTVVPLPPYDEQKRIVEKIKKLFQLADLFEGQIEESTRKQVQILNSVLANI